MTAPIESKTHVLNPEHDQSMCGNAVLGDRAITLEQARDMNNGMYFDCAECYKALSGQEPV